MGTTFVYITHDQSEALVMSDHVAVMNKGRFEQSGHPSESLPPPPHPLRGPFRGGEQRLVRGGCARWEERGRWRSKTASGRIFKSRATEPLQTGDRVELFLRPEAMIIQPGDDVPHLNRFEVIVKSLLFDGANSRLLVHPVNGDTELLIALPQNRQFDYIRRDDKIEVGWDAQSGICFAGEESP